VYGAVFPDSREVPVFGVFTQQLAVIPEHPIFSVSKVLHSRVQEEP